MLQRIFSGLVIEVAVILALGPPRTTSVRDPKKPVVAACSLFYDSHLFAPVLTAGRMNRSTNSELNDMLQSERSRFSGGHADNEEKSLCPVLW